MGNEDQFGRALAAADLNGDGKAEVIAGAHVGDDEVKGLRDSGWVRVFDGESGEVLRQLNGTSAQDHFGKSVAVGDVDDDGQPDVIVGAEWGTVAGESPPGAGYVRAFKGLTDTVLLEVHGSCHSDHLGTSVAVRPVDGTGPVNILAGAPDGDADAKLDNGYVRLY